jgi:tetratricopeptide (TPR) repeat protein
LVAVGLAFGVGVGGMMGESGNAQGPDNWAVTAEMSTRRLAENPKDEKAWADLLRAQIQLGDLERAEKTLKNWRAKVSSPQAASESLEGELALARDDAARAVKAFRSYVEKAPKDDGGWRLLASAYEEEKDWDKAVDAMGQALMLRADAAGFLQRGKLRMEMGDWAGAEADVREANRRDATNPEVRGLFPIFERSMAWLPKLRTLEAAVKGHPRDAQVLLDRGEWLRANGLMDLAREDFKAAFGMNPKSLRARVWYGLMRETPGNANVSGNATMSGRPEKVDNLGVVPMAPGRITADFARELKALDAGDDAEARAQFLVRYGQPVLGLREVEALEGSPAKAQALIDLGRLPEAGRAARQATERHADSAVAWLALAEWELNSGNNREAIDAAQRAEKLQKTAQAEDVRKTAQQRLGK